jgi:hypothetical protein
MNGKLSLWAVALAAAATVACAHAPVRAGATPLAANPSTANAPRLGNIFSAAAPPSTPGWDTHAKLGNIF